MGSFLSRIIRGPIPAYAEANGSKIHGFPKANEYRKGSDEDGTQSITYYSPSGPITTAIQDLLDDSRLLQTIGAYDEAKIKQRMAMKAKKLAGDLLGPEAMIGAMAVSVSENI
jgi:hypothetical protein